MGLWGATTSDNRSANPHPVGFPAVTVNEFGLPMANHTAPLMIVVRCPMRCRPSKSDPMAVLRGAFASNSQHMLGRNVYNMDPTSLPLLCA